MWKSVIGRTDAASFWGHVLTFKFSFTRRPLVGFLAVSFFLLPSSLQAWGERAHHAIGRMAALRITLGVDRKGLSLEEARLYRSLEKFYRNKAVEMGHVSNIPDIHWKGLDKKTRAENFPTHFLDADALVPASEVASLPLDYRKFLKRFHGKPNRIDGKKLDVYRNGTLPWRAQQLYDLMVQAFKKAKKADPGSPVYKKAVRSALTYGGLLSHFVGDASQPLHFSYDYDGYRAGNGGIHRYFEVEIVNILGPGLEVQVYEKMSGAAERFGLEQKLRALPEKHKVCGLMLALGQDSLEVLPKLFKIDTRVAVRRKSQDKTPAERVPPEEAVPKFKDMIEDRVALGAAVLARLWRSAWEDGGKPDLAPAHFYDYALSPAFITPDYDPAALRRIAHRLKSK